MRLELSDLQEGAYAEIRDKAPWGLTKRVAKYAGVSSDKLTPDANLEITSAMLETMVKEWNVKDVDGSDVPIPSKATTDQIDLIDAPVVAKVITEIRNVLDKTKTDPNSATASSES